MNTFLTLSLGGADSSIQLVKDMNVCKKMCKFQILYVEIQIKMGLYSCWFQQPVQTHINSYHLSIRAPPSEVF